MRPGRHMRPQLRTCMTGSPPIGGNMRRMFIAIAVLATNACSQSPGRLVVRTVSDTTGNPLAGVSVQVAAQPWTLTDAEGKATFDALPGPFTVRVHSSDQVLVLSGRTGPEVV